MSPATWIIVGATCDIGLEFVRQLLRRGERVIATARSTSKASQLWTLTAGAVAPGWGSWCRLLECDVTVDESINVCFFSLRLCSPPFCPQSGVEFFSEAVEAYLFIFFSSSFSWAEWLALQLLDICGGCDCHEGCATSRLRCLECRDPQVSQCK